MGTLTTGARCVHRGVGTLAWTTTAQDLRQRFEPSGTVDTMRMLTDRATGRSRGCGCVAMPDGQAAPRSPDGETTAAHRRRDGAGIPRDAAGEETDPLHTKEEHMPAGRQRRTPPPERPVWGLTILSPSHPEVRRLQQAAVQPTLHGHKVWPTSLVLLDYLHQRGLPPQTRVLELGCGWGLVGIACAKTFQAQVTGLDADAAVFPYLQPHAARNGVHLATRQGTFAELTAQDLAACHLAHSLDSGSLLVMVCIGSSVGRPYRRRWAGLAAARARGRTGGRPPALTAADKQAARALLKDPAITVEAVAKRLQVSPATLYRHFPGGRSGLDEILG